MDRFKIPRDIWNRGSVSVGRSRSRSRSVVSRSIPEWGGEADSRSSFPVASPESGCDSGVLHNLLPSDNPHPDLESAYHTFTQQLEMGPAAA